MCIDNVSRSLDRTTGRCFNISFDKTTTVAAATNRDEVHITHLSLYDYLRIPKRIILHYQFLQYYYFVALFIQFTRVG